MSYLKILILLFITIFFTTVIYADCVNGSRIEQGTGFLIEGDCVEPPELPYPDKYDCGAEMQLIQGTAESCASGTAVDDPGIWLPNCEVDHRLTQGTTEECVYTPNQAPIADAGPDQNITVTYTVTLDGSASSDPEGVSLSYSWNFTSKPVSSNAILSDETVVHPTFTADEIGEYILQLIVSDGKEESTFDSVMINVIRNSDVGP